MANKVQDIVAIFPQTELNEPEKLIFQEYSNRKDRKVFLAKGMAVGTGMKSINLVGTEDKAGDGYEYVLATVDRKTGTALSFRPTALINFQPRFEQSLDEITKKELKWGKIFAK